VIDWRLEVFESLSSTSDTCIEKAKSGEPAGLSILAERQTAGRGSRGRQWQSLAGNLNLSILLRPNLPATQASIFPLLTGIAAADALSAFLPAEIAPQLKWPNDVLLNGAKLAGILIDAAPQGQLLGWLVIGIGINLMHAPKIPGRPATTLQAHGGKATPLQAANRLLQELDFWLDAFATSGPAAIIDAWQLRAHPIGTPLTVQTAERSTTGSYAGLSPKGELLLRVENRIERFQTGEILLGSRG
jgi:BirA family biotin operon repressor/biotin-[acetyl-CoA-carboxylase] ligase